MPTMSSRPKLTLAGALCAAAIFVLQAAPVMAQEESDRNYKVEAEAGASLFFGATSQTTVIFKSSADYHDWERVLLAGRLAYDYGEAQDDEQVTFVNKRSWIAEAQLDYLPGGNWSPFVLGSVEGSLERRIERRYAGAAGVRWTPLDEDGKKFDLAGGAKAERTTPKVDVGEVAVTETVGRLYTRGELAWPLGERVAFSLITTYEPDFSDFGNYTVGVDTGIQFNMNSSIALKLSLLDRYDSSAKSRGALSNNDGRLFFSIIAGVS
jgi:opacity protein-like surface antigen